eukprot:TRINITY_DN3806_c0_g1_i1.p1 TRINITY_DN3806_c0_g1~~TRINITY_DN3806_c0_g1_i1.p1  ORF type:complete len:935 (+),score=226.72 TRINITY_DN3806_c0_g1_i1:190-2994(+)
MGAVGFKRRKQKKVTAKPAIVEDETAGRKQTRNHSEKAASKGDARRAVSVDKGGSQTKSGDAARVDSSAVFMKGLPTGTADNDIRTWLEGRIGPTVTCFVIRDDYGLVKFKEEADARRCLEELQGADFNGSTLRLEAAKPKRPATATSASDTGGGKDSASGSKRKRPREDVGAGGKSEIRESQGDVGGSKDSAVKQSGIELRSVQLSGLSSSLEKEAVRAWVEEKLPGGCGLEHVRRAVGGNNEDTTSGNDAVFVVTFRKEQNASRALEVLDGADLQGCIVAASYRALALSKESSKAGRLIIRNLAFGATEKHVRKTFATIGVLKDVHLPTKPGKEGLNRGFGFVQFEDIANAERAIKELNGSKVCGRGIAVDWAVDSQLYTGLQREEQHQPSSQKQSRKDKRSGADQDAEDDTDGATKGDEDTQKELRRMKKLLTDEEKGSDADEDEDKDEEEEEEEDEEEERGKSKAKAKAKAAPRTPGFDIDQGRTVFIRNVPFESTQEQIRDVLKRFGRVQFVKFVADNTGQNAHRGSCFVQFRDAEGCEAALACEAAADRKLKEMAFVKKTDKRELPAVEGFGISLNGRRLVLKKALAPGEVEKLGEEKDKDAKKAAKAADKRQWMHLLNLGRISERCQGWDNLSNSEKRQRAASIKERKFRVNNPNFLIDPLRLSVRNLPRYVDAVKLREAVVKHLGDKFSPEDASRKTKMHEGQSRIAKISLVRDDDRRGEKGERRSKGYGFIAFKDNPSALKVLELLNDNPEVFGGGKRPIVEFAIEDKRKLRMQDELFRKHGHKLKPELKGGADSKDNVTNKSKGSGKGEGKESEGSSGKEHKIKKNKKKEGFSRGRMQREKRRAQKAAEAEKATRKEIADSKWEEAQVRKANELAIKREHSKKRIKQRDIPDASGPKAKRQRKVGDLPDDFELQMMNRFRLGGK